MHKKRGGYKGIPIIRAVRDVKRGIESNVKKRWGSKKGINTDQVVLLCTNSVHRVT